MFLGVVKILSKGWLWVISGRWVTASVWRRGPLVVVLGATLVGMLGVGGDAAMAQVTQAVPAVPAPPTTPAPRLRGDEFGIVVNQTFTPGGQEFYRRFTDFWREKSDFESYTLVILERPSRRYGNAIFVSYGQRVMYSSALPVKIDAIRAMSSDAVDKAYANIISLTLRFSGDNDPDIGPDEL